jgi:hypothetical protein
VYANLRSEQPSSRADFDRLMVQLRFLFGEVTSTEYRNEMLILSEGDTIALLTNPHAQLQYAIATTKWGRSAELFFEVTLSRSAGSCVVSGFRIHKYLTGLPEDLRHPRPSAGT